MTFENLKGTPQEDLRRALLAGLARLRANEHQPRLIPYHALLHEAGTALGRVELLHPLKSNQVAFVGRTGSGKPWDEHYDNVVILSAIWSLVAEGIIVPRLLCSGNNALNEGKAVIEIGFVSLTPLGEAILVGAADHPRFPGSLQRLLTRHPALTDEILPRLDDAIRCIERNLARPAVVMTGLAMETTLANVEKAWVTLAYATARSGDRTPQALDRLVDAKKTVEQNYQKNEPRQRLLFAVLAAEQVRHQRNLAAHDPAESFSTSAADELLRIAVGAIDTFYELVVDPNLP